MNSSEKTGILLVNLGTPDAPTPEAIKRYLAEFLHDRHVVDLSPLIWYPLLHGIILPRRVKYIMRDYQAIWTEQGSPLLKYSQALAQQVALAMPDNPCELAMTYGNPSLSDTLSKLADCQRLIVLPLFPQYSTTTTLAVKDKLTEVLLQWQKKLQIDFIASYADNPGYITALVSHIQQAFQQHGQPDTLLLSFHSIPERYVIKRAESYVQQCQLTAQLVTQQLASQQIDVSVEVSYQSKFGKGKWVGPSTTETLQMLAKTGKRHVQVICPGFAVDCIETIEEIDRFNRGEFLAAGGEVFHYIPALNDSPEQVTFISELIKQHF